MDGRQSSPSSRNVATTFLAVLLALSLFVLVPFSSSVAEGRDGPSISIQPQDTEVSDGEAAVFSVTAIGTGVLFYQWYLVNGGGDGRDSPVGSNSSTYDTGAVTTENTGQQYYVIITDDIGSTRSNTVTLTVMEGLSITRQPQDATVISGNSATFTVEAAGDSSYTYQWYVDANTGTWVAQGANEPSYSTHSVTTEQEGWRFYVRVTGASGDFLDSSIATLHVITGFLFTTQPENARVIIGGMATFTAEAIGPGELTYQWFVDVSDGRWSSVGPGGRTYTTPALTTDYNGYLYMCRVYGAEGRSQDSSTATLTVFPPSPYITRNPEDASAFSGDTATFTVEAQGDEPLSYFWSVDRGNGLWVELSNAGNVYTTGLLAQEYEGYRYHCVVSDSNGRSQVSNPAVLHILKSLAIIRQPQDVGAVIGSSARFSITLYGEEPFGYQWFFSLDGGKTWKPVGGSSASISLSTTLITHENLLVYCRVTDAYSHELQSQTAVLTLVPATGDGAEPLYWILSLLTSAGLLGVLLRHRRLRIPPINKR